MKGDERGGVFGYGRSREYMTVKSVLSQHCLTSGEHTNLQARRGVPRV